MAQNLEEAHPVLLHVDDIPSFNYELIFLCQDPSNETIVGFREVSHKQSRLQIPQDNPCSRKATSSMRHLLKQQSKGLTKLYSV